MHIVKLAVSSTPLYSCPSRTVSDSLIKRSNVENECVFVVVTTPYCQGRKHSWNIQHLTQQLLGLWADSLENCGSRQNVGALLNTDGLNWPAELHRYDDVWRVICAAASQRDFAALVSLMPWFL